MRRLLGITLERSEWWFIGIVTAAVLVVTTIPSIYGVLIAGADTEYWGVHALGSGDLSVYYSYLEQVKQGHWFFNDLFTTEPHDRIFVNPLWLAVGALAALVKSNFAAFQIARVVLAVPFCILLYYFGAYFFTERWQRRTSFFFLLFASGIGVFIGAAITDVVGASAGRPGYIHLPPDFWVPEGSNFLTILQSPHFIAASTLLLLVFLLLLAAYEQRRARLSVLAGVAALVLFSFHPFHIPTVAGVAVGVGLALTIRYRGQARRWWAHTAIVLGIASPAVLYYLLLTGSHWLVSAKYQQNITTTPAWWLVAAGYGFLLPLAVAGLKSTALRGVRWCFFVGWVVVQTGLVFAPMILYQRRLLQGLQFPIVLLAAAGAFVLYGSLKRRLSAASFERWANRWVLTCLFVLLLTFANLYSLAYNIVELGGRPRSYFLPTADVAAFDWLASETPEDAAILAPFPAANLIPGRTGRATYAGHTVETAFFWEKIRKEVMFFDAATTDIERRAFLVESGIDYLYYEHHSPRYLYVSAEGVVEAGSFDPSRASYLSAVFANEAATIYEVLETQ